MAETLSSVAVVLKNLLLLRLSLLRERDPFRLRLVDSDGGNVDLQFVSIEMTINAGNHHLFH